MAGNRETQPGSGLESLTLHNLATVVSNLDAAIHVLATGNKFLVSEVGDIAQASAELAEMSVAFVWREKEIAPGYLSTAIRDLDGNLINILSRR